VLLEASINRSALPYNTHTHIHTESAYNTLSPGRQKRPSSSSHRRNDTISLPRSIIMRDQFLLPALVPFFLLTAVAAVPSGYTSWYQPGDTPVAALFQKRYTPSPSDASERTRSRRVSQPDY
jgi:hypothetical protein